MEQSRPNILFIDDEQAVLKLVKTILKRADYDVTTCESAEEALKIMDEQHFDLVITDAVMPNLSGFDFVRSLRAHPMYKDFPIIMLTKRRNREDVQKALSLGVTDYVVKPIDQQLLLDKVGTCLKNKKASGEIYQLALASENIEASLTVKCRVTSISETGITVLSTVPIEPRTKPEISTSLFEEIGIDQPFFRFIKCDPIEDMNDRDAKASFYDVTFSFVGVQETHLRQIRSWIQKETIRKRK